MSDFVILVPVLARPQNAAPLIASIEAASRQHHRVVFITSPNDRPERVACQATGADVLTVPWERGAGDWARKLEHARRHTTEPYMLLGADDLHFHPGWDTNALRVFDAMEHVGVVGTLDGGNPLVMRGLHSTHPIVVRDYADQCGAIDDCDNMLHLGYDHQYADNELCETAMARGAWHFARDVYIEHMHPCWEKGEHDDTYEKAFRWAVRDHQHFIKRRPMWRPRGRQRMLLRPRGAPSSGTGSDGSVAPSARYGQIAHRRGRA